ncbi:MAG: hypothetical protein LRY51_04985 [Geovibrio sp.]|nr:hypothetical protein [Geovibrio sp.]
MEAPIVMIMKDLLKPEKVVETHISYVFLTGDKVYKVKKNVNFGFLDFSRLKLRKQYCLLEKELNGRFCEGIYGDVLKVARKDKSFEITAYENTQNTLEYVVTMKRIPEENFLSHRVKEGLITEDDMRVTGRHIAELFFIHQNRRRLPQRRTAGHRLCALTAWRTSPRLKALQEDSLIKHSTIS